MKTMLVGLNPGGIVGMAPYYLKSYYAGRVDAEAARNITIVGYDVGCDHLLAQREIVHAAPDVLGFSCYVWNVEQILELCADIRRDLPHAKIVLGGPEASPRATELMTKYPMLDVVAVGEGEVTFSEILQNFATGTDNLSGVKGTVYRDGGGIHMNEARPVIQNLDEIPSPFLTGIVEFEKMKGYLFGYETFRGCPFTCSFCYWGRMLSVRYFPMERIKAELQIILNSSLRRMWLGDAVANLHKKRFKEFLRAIIELDTDTIIDFEMVAEILDDETIDLMGQLRDGYVAFGLQSINHEALATVTRKWKEKEFTENVRKLRARTDKIKIYIDLIYGLPEDSPASYEKGIRYAMSLLPQKIQPHPLLLLAGSPLFDSPESFGIIYDENAPHYVLENKWWSRADMATAAAWSDKLFFYFNPAVNVTVAMVSQLLEEDPFELFQRLYNFVAERFDPNTVTTDIGIQRELALRLNDVLEEFIVVQLEPRFTSYLPALTDVMAFAGCKTMFYAAGAADAGAISASFRSDMMYPALSRHVVLKRFAHDMSACYGTNTLRSPDALLGMKAAAYDVVFNLLTHSIYHVSEHLSELLAACSGNANLSELVVGLAQRRKLEMNSSAHDSLQETFADLARKQVVELSHPAYA